MTPLLRIEQLGVDFHGRAAITDVSLTVDTGESVALVGGSGAGKSTVARCGAGLVELSSGRILSVMSGIYRCPVSTAIFVPVSGARAFGDLSGAESARRHGICAHVRRGTSRDRELPVDLDNGMRE